MKKAVSIILILGVVAALFSLAACGDEKQDMTSLMDEGSTLLSDIGEDISENLSEALSDERTTEEETEEINTTDTDNNETTLSSEEKTTTNETITE